MWHDRYSYVICNAKKVFAIHATQKHCYRNLLVDVHKNDDPMLEPQLWLSLEGVRFTMNSIEFEFTKPILTLILTTPYFLVKLCLLSYTHPNLFGYS